TFWFKIRVEQNWYYIQAEKTVEKPWKMARQDEDGPTTHYPANLTAKEAIKGAGHIMRRFNFENCLLESMQINDKFLEYFEHVIATRSFVKLELSECRYNEISDYNVKMSFASLLLLARPTEIESYYCSDNTFINAHFLVDFAQAIPSVEFYFYNINERVFEETGEGFEFDPYSSITSDDRLAEFLPKFKSLQMRCLVVNTDSLIPALLDRQSMAMKGSWEFRITRNFSHAEIEALMGSEYEYDNYDGKDCWDNGDAVDGQIESIATGQIEDKDRSWSFTVNFVGRE
ncbi:hypothetical protein PENTCL1PPCAC_16016, partial [Pristionchus entomophagus]